MTSSLDQNSVSPTSNRLEDCTAPSKENEAQTADETLRPGVFFMTDTLETGGSERQFAALAQSLDARSFRLHLGCIQKRGAFLANLSEVQEFPVGGNLYGLGSIRMRLRLARHLRSLKIAIAHAFDFYSNLTLIPAARLARLQVLIGSQRQLGDLLTWKQTRAQAAVLRWCDRVVCNSRAAADGLVKLGVPEARLVVIGNGLPREAFIPTEPALPLRSGLRRVGMIARMNTRAKNHQLFLRCAARLASRFPELEFVLAGDGPLRPELEQDAQRLQLGDRVHFLGDRRDMPAVLASMVVSVLPSASESLSNVILESMAMGVPVVAHPVGGNPELIAEDRGVLVPPDESALADAIERLLCDEPLRARLGHNAREFALANFTMERMQKKHEELYAQLLVEKGWTPAPRRATKSPAQPLRVAIVAASLRYVGGQSAQADLLLRHWKNDPEVEARFIPIDPVLPRALRWVARIPLLRTLVREPIYLWALWRDLKDVEIAHIFSASYWSFLVAPAMAWLVARIRRTKTLIHYHSGEARDHLRRFRSALLVLKRADSLVVPSGYLVEVFREFGLSAKAVPNIVDVSKFCFRARSPLRPHLVCTRGFHPYYCVDVAVRAFAEVQRAFPEARLDLVGQGPCETEIRNLVREMKLSDAHFTGVVPWQEIALCYDQADIFINASRLDNMPVSVLEAFASGTPVVSTAPDGMRFLVEHERTGLLSEPGDPHALAENVIRLLRDPALGAQLAANARAAIGRYSWPAVREEWLEIYRLLLLGKEEVARDLIAVD
jgi:glycosyltransferase involved in cell wall biosynthesis